MTRFKPVALLAAALFFVTLLIPTILVLPFGNDKASGSLGENVTAEEENTESVGTEPIMEVAVYRTAKKTVEKSSIRRICSWCGGI